MELKIEVSGMDINRSFNSVRHISNTIENSKPYIIWGKDDKNQNNIKWEFDDDTILQRHLLVLGAIGSGKTNFLYQLVQQIQNQMDENDKMVIFDTKGDFLKFYSEGDSVISINQTGKYKYEKWNIFEDIKIEEENFRMLAADEIVSTLFQQSIESSINPFFPKAARDVVLATVLQLLKHKSNPDNSDLKKYIFGSKNEKNELFNWLKSDPGWAWVIDYLPVESQQASGVYGEIYSTMRPFLQAPFDESGNFSIRRFVRQEKKSKLFLEYSINTSMVLKPLYSVFYDLAIKEVLSRNISKGKVFFIIDEFSLLPYLHYIENGINFGRDRGARFVIAAQNMNQIVINQSQDKYGEYKGRSLVSGIGTIVAFALYDKLSRDIVSEKYGKNVKNYLVMHRRMEEGYQNNLMIGNVIEDNDLSTLKLGETVICPPSSQPFKFNFIKFNND